MATSKPSAPTFSLPLRITVVDPPPGIAWALQLGRDQLVAPTSRTAREISFDFTVDVVEDAAGKFRLRGPAVQGKPGERFVYLCTGTYAGQYDAPSGGRAKISLEGINRQMIDTIKAKGSGLLHVQFAGTGRNGHVAGATVPLLGEGWHFVKS